MPEEQEQNTPDTVETNEAASQPAVPVPKKSRRALLVRLGIAVLAIVSITTTMLILKPSITFNSVQKPISEMSNAEKEAYAEKIKAQVAKNMIMPDETPEIMAAADQYKELLGMGMFWYNLERDDLILVFTENDPWVVIWRPKDKLIVNVGPIVEDSTTQQTLPEGGAGQ